MELVMESTFAIDKDRGMEVMAYIDDIFISMKASLEKHYTQVSQVFQLFMDNHICIKFDKCIFDAKEVPLLRFIVSWSGLRMDPDKAKAIVTWPWPTNKKEVQQLLDIWNFYRRLVPGYTTIVSPITDCLRGKDKDISSNEAQEAAFLKITIWFTSGKTQILRHYDSNRPALVKTDDSDFAIADKLSQKSEDGRLHPFRFISRKLSPAELNHDVFDKEMLAIVFSLRKLRHLIQDAEQKRIFYSDHQDLTYFNTAVLLNRWQAQWEEDIQTLNLDLFYREGCSNLKADMLPRCLLFTSRERGTTAAGNESLLSKELGLEVGARQIKDDGIE
jgi:hypothetical protein